MKKYKNMGAHLKMCRRRVVQACSDPGQFPSENSSYFDACAPRFGRFEIYARRIYK
jgi:hypothetical protein